MASLGLWNADVPSWNAAHDIPMWLQIERQTQRQKDQAHEQYLNQVRVLLYNCVRKKCQARCPRDKVFH